MKKKDLDFFEYLKIIVVVDIKCLYYNKYDNYIDIWSNQQKI